MAQPAQQLNAQGAAAEQSLMGFISLIASTLRIGNDSSKPMDETEILDNERPRLDLDFPDVQHCLMISLHCFSSNPPKKQHPLPYRGKTVDVEEVTAARKQRDDDNFKAAQRKAVEQALA